MAVVGHDKAAHDGLTHDVDGVLDADALAARIVARFTVVSDPHGAFEPAAMLDDDYRLRLPQVLQRPGRGPCEDDAADAVHQGGFGRVVDLDGLAEPSVGE